MGVAAIAAVRKAGHCKSLPGHMALSPGRLDQVRVDSCDMCSHFYDSETDVTNMRSEQPGLKQAMAAMLLQLLQLLRTKISIAKTTKKRP